MKLLQRVGILCTSLVITSCAATRPQLTEVPTPPKRIPQNGYSLVPLNEKGWMIVGRDAYQLALIKPGENQDETFGIQAIPFKLSAYKTNEEFVSMVKEGQIKDTQAPRFTIVNHEVSSYPMKGTDCAKSHMVTEDHAAVKRSGKTGDMIFEVLSITCALPSEKNVGISIAYSQRNYPGQGDPAFVEKATSILSSVEFAEPQQIDSLSPASKFSALCSDILVQSSNNQPKRPPEQKDAKQATELDPLSKLATIGISIGQNSGTRGDGSYALFVKGQNGAYSLTEVKPSFIELKDFENQEELFVSNGLDSIAPAFEKYSLNKDQAFVCGTGFQFVTGIDSSKRVAYNPCDSSLTSASNVGTSIMANTALTVLTLGANLVTGSSARFVDTDKEKVAGLIVNSKLFQCLTQASQIGLKTEAATIAAKVISDAKQSDLGKLDGGGDCSESAPKVSAETYFQRGKALVAMNKYKGAMHCLMRAQEEEKDTQLYRDTCFQIATMYELGWGVDKDMGTSKAWLKKAGL